MPNAARWRGVKLASPIGTKGVGSCGAWQLEAAGATRRAAFRRWQCDRAARKRGGQRREAATVAVIQGVQVVGRTQRRWRGWRQRQRLWRRRGHLIPRAVLAVLFVLGCHKSQTSASMTALPACDDAVEGGDFDAQARARTVAWRRSLRVDAIAIKGRHRRRCRRWRL